jgi:hypothetical protein
MVFCIFVSEIIPELVERIQRAYQFLIRLVILGLPAADSTAKCDSTSLHHLPCLALGIHDRDIVL